MRIFQAHCSGPGKFLRAPRGTAGVEFLSDQDMDTKTREKPSRQTLSGTDDHSFLMALDAVKHSFGPVPSDPLPFIGKVDRGQVFEY